MVLPFLNGKLIWLLQQCFEGCLSNSMHDMYSVFQWVIMHVCSSNN